MEILLVTAIFNVFACTYVCGYPDHLTQGHGTLGQLYKALNTSGPVWMLRRSYTDDNRKCVYTVKKSLKQYNYEFFRYYTDSQGLQKEELYATLDTEKGELYGTPGPKFTVHKKNGEQPGTPYILVEWSDDHHCAILYYKENGSAKAKCEAYIWNQDLATGMEACLELFTSYCPKDPTDKEQAVYNNNCRVDPGC